MQKETVEVPKKTFIGNCRHPTTTCYYLDIYVLYKKVGKLLDVNRLGRCVTVIRKKNQPKMETFKDTKDGKYA